MRRETLERLGREGVPAAGDTGESDPGDAIQDALRTFRADRIVVFSQGRMSRHTRVKAPLATTAR